MQAFSDKCEVAVNEKLGRHFIAGVDISVGDVILEEKPLFVTPHWECFQMKCSQCFSDSYIICKKCRVFPLCLYCTTHNEFDCNFFQEKAKHINKKFLVKNYGIYALLKLLLAMENPTTFADCEPLLLSKNVNLDEYRERDPLKLLELVDNVVDPLLDSGVVKLFTGSGSVHKIDADFLLKLCMQIDANARCIDCSSDSLKGVYVGASQLPHSCVPNTAVAIADDFQMKIYATVPIKRDAIIYTSYTNPMMGTIQRQHHLRSTKNIECACPRCLDPTELGTHMSSMKCQKCLDGYAVCDLNNTKNWICTECASIIVRSEVEELQTSLIEQIADQQSGLDGYEALLASYSTYFHRQHFLIIDIKQKIVTALRKSSSVECGLSKKFLRRRVQLCGEFLPLVRTVLPGVSKMHAIALYEYLMPFIELNKFEFKDEDIPLDVYLRKQKMALAIATAALKMLAYEPANSPEGELMEHLSMELRHIQENINKYCLEK